MADPDKPVDPEIPARPVQPVEPQKGGFGAFFEVYRARWAKYRSHMRRREAVTPVAPGSKEPAPPPTSLEKPPAANEGSRLLRPGEHP